MPSSKFRCCTGQFKRYIWGSLGVLAVLALLCAVSLVSYSEKDRLAYRELVDATTSPAKEQEGSAIAQQNRKEIRKDIFYLQGNQRLALNMTAATSTLELDQLGASTEIIEQLKDVKGFMQEELYYQLPDGREAFLQQNGRLLLRNGDPLKDQDWVDYSIASLKAMQLLRYFEAERATYHYKDNHLQTQQFKFARYAIPGHSVDTSIEALKPIMTAVALSAEIALAGDTQQFKASHLKAAFYQQEPIHFEAQEAAYDGKSMALSGDVLLEHPLGNLSANQAILNGISEGKKLRLNFLDLYDQVNFTLSEGGELSCAEAHLNQIKNRGEFYGSSSQPFVVYMEQCRDSYMPDQRLPIIVKSHAMTVEFKSAELNSPKSHINTITASDNVTVDYNHDFIAAADLATFHREENDEETPNGLSGIICLQAEGVDGHCHVTNRNGDLIHARQIFVDTRNRRLSFVHPKGALFASRAGGGKERIDFSSDTLNWEEQEGALNLLGHVMIAQKGLGKLTSDDQVTLNHVLANGRKQLSTIESKGHTVLTHQEENKDPAKDCSHVLQCNGKMVVDHTNLKVTMDSPETEGGQVFYQDRYGRLYADLAVVKYDWIDGAIKPGKITLEGHVKMVNNPAKSGSSGRQQFALADFVEIFPSTQEAHLYSKEGRRVLAYDQVNDMQVSAQGLKIKRDELTKKESIQGVGDVRFNFLDPEFEQLYKRFEQLQKPFKDKHD